MPSPNADWGYDVADYCAVLPDYGTMADLDEVIAAAGKLGLQVGSQPAGAFRVEGLLTSGRIRGYLTASGR